MDDFADELLINGDDVSQLLGQLRNEVVGLIELGRLPNEIVNTLIGRMLLLESTDGHFQRYEIVKKARERVSRIVAPLIDLELRELLKSAFEVDKNSALSPDMLAAIEDISSSCCGNKDFLSLQKLIVNEVRSAVSLVSNKFNDAAMMTAAAGGEGSTIYSDYMNPVTTIEVIAAAQDQAFLHPYRCFHTYIDI
jgi:hypothetical protein